MSYKVTERGVKQRFTFALEMFEEQSWIGQIAELFTSDQEKEKYPFLGTPAPMRKWEGERAKVEPAEYEFEITNEPYENSMILRGNLIRRDKVGAVNNLIDQFARRRVEHWLDLVIALIEAGETETTWDGDTFFGSAHVSRNSGTQDNDLTFDVTTTTDPSDTETIDAILQAIESMIGYVDDQGKPMNENLAQVLLLVPVGLMSNFSKALGNQFVQGTGGPISNAILALPGIELSMRVLPRLSWTTKFAMFRTDAPVLPFIRQEEDQFESGVEILGDGSEWMFENDSWKVGTKASRNAGYANWQYANLTTFI